MMTVTQRLGLTLFLFGLLLGSESLLAQADWAIAAKQNPSELNLSADTFFPPPPPIAERGEAVCLTCEGTGSVTSKFKTNPKRKPSTSKRYQTNLDKSPDFIVPCKACSGKKQVVRKRTLQERVTARLNVLRQYEQLHSSKHHIPFGSAYIVSGSLDDLPPESYAIVAAAYPEACEKCQGFGMLPCSRCQSTGQLRKKAKDDTSEETFEPCTACDGSGEKACKTCNTVGLKRYCRRCKGTGLGEEKATRLEAAKTVRCRTCNGMGRQ
ncbi:MAG: hypothetical protein IKW23_00995 [Kiritimatiellae bacterium]|nr:hypothetical protein [Kiritimatiellia bacterium]